MISIDTGRTKDNKRTNSVTTSACEKMGPPDEDEEKGMDTDQHDPQSLDASNKPPTPAGIERYFQIVSRKRKREQLNAEDADSSNTSQGKHSIAGKVNFHNGSQRDSGLATSNRFAALSDESDTPPKPPPIYVRVQNNAELIQGIKSLIKKDLFYVVDIKRGQLKETKIQVQREVDYCQIANWLSKKGMQYYTYQLKSEKGLRVVIKGIDHNVPTEEIKQDLEELGFKVKYVHNILNRYKQPQPMFKIELMPESSKSPKGKIHPIYEVRYILNRKITIEEPYKRKIPIQCKNCQEFGHTKTYCKLNNVCVACGGSHPTTACPEIKGNATVKKCSNCDGNHTANYKGCPVYIAIQSNQKQQQLHSKITINTDNYRAPNNPSTINTTRTTPTPHPAYNRDEYTYANILKNNGQPAANNQNESIMQILITLTNNINQLTQTIQQMQSMMNKQTEILSKLIK